VAPPQQRYILIVDDDPSIRTVTVEMLKRLDCHARAVDSGEAALAALQESGWDIILIDLAMPEMSGMQLYSAVRAACPALPVVIMTGLTTSAPDALITDGSPTWLLYKPFSVKELDAILARAVSDRSRCHP
jgi:DNA-binding NtrC family response regulator